MKKIKFKKLAIVKNNEQTDFMSKCIRKMIDEGKPREQAIAICISKWQEGKTNLDE